MGPKTVFSIDKTYVFWYALSVTTLTTLTTLAALPALPALPTLAALTTLPTARARIARAAGLVALAALPALARLAALAGLPGLAGVREVAPAVLELVGRARQVAVRGDGIARIAERLGQPVEGLLGAGRVALGEALRRVLEGLAGRACPGDLPRSRSWRCSSSDR